MKKNNKEVKLFLFANHIALSFLKRQRMLVARSVLYTVITHF